MLLYLVVVWGSLLFGSVAAQECATPTAITEVKGLVDDVHTKLDPLVSGLSDRDNPSVQVQHSVVSTICQDIETTALLEQIDEKVKNCVPLMAKAATGLSTLKLGPLDFFSLFDTNSSVSNFCLCIVNRTLEFIGQGMVLQTRLAGVEQDKIAEEMCSDETTLRPILGQIKSILDECPSMKVYASMDPLTMMIMEHDSVDDFCYCATFDVGNFSVELGTLGQTLSSLMSTGNQAAIIDGLCSDAMKTPLQYLKAIVDACPFLADMVPGDAFLGMSLHDIFSYDSIDKYCNCVTSLLCMKDVDIAEITETNEVSPWKILPNFDYICTEKVSCAQSGLVSCRSGIAEKFEVAATDVDRVVHVQSFAAKYCSSMTQTVLTTTGRCLRERTATLTVNRCYLQAKASISDAVKACDVRDCIKDAVKSCGSDALELFIEAVNLYQDDKVKTTDAGCGADAISISLLLLATGHMLAWIGKE